MDKLLLDTDMFSEILKGRNATVLYNAQTYRIQQPHFTTSVITVMELIKGLHRKGETAAIERLRTRLQGVEQLPLDAWAADLAGHIYADLDRVGRPIGIADIFIASIAIEHNLTLVTGNTRHYAYVQSVGYDLSLVNWRDRID